MAQAKKVWFPFLPLDYKAAEGWLNEQAQQGWALLRFCGWGRVELAQQSPPRRYAAILGVTSTESTVRPYHQEQFSKYVAFVESCGWEYVAQRELLHIFASQPGESPPPLETDPVAEAGHIRAYYINQLVYTLIAVGLLGIFLLLALVGPSYSALALALNTPLITLLLCALGGIAILARLAQLLLLQWRLRRSEQLVQPLPVRSLRAARARWVVVCAGIAAVPLLLLIGVVVDVCTDPANFRTIGALLFPVCTILVRPIAYPPGKPPRILRGILVSFLLLAGIGAATLATLNRPPRPVPLEEARKLPVVVLSQSQAVPPANRINRQRSPLMEVFNYSESISGLGYADSIYASACSRPLADRAYDELLHRYAYFDLESVAQGALFPGIDRAELLADTTRHILVVQQGNACLLLHWRLGEDVTWETPALQQAVLRALANGKEAA